MRGADAPGERGFGAGEERFSRVKQHAGFPALAIRAALEATNTDPAELDQVAYPFLTSEREAKHIRDAMTSERSLARDGASASELKRLITAAKTRVPERSAPVHAGGRMKRRHTLVCALCALCAFAYWNSVSRLARSPAVRAQTRRGWPPRRSSAFRAFLRPTTRARRLRWSRGRYGRRSSRCPPLYCYLRLCRG